MVSFPLVFQPIIYKRSSSPHSCYMPRPSHPPRLDHSNYTWRRVQIMKLRYYWKVNRRNVEGECRGIVDVLSQHSPGRNDKSTKSLSEINWCPSRGSNRNPVEYNSREILLGYVAPNVTVNWEWLLERTGKEELRHPVSGPNPKPPESEDKRFINTSLY
jgi:hypothetical protein